MNRLQKKCFLFSAAFHTVLLLTVAFGSAFFVAHEPARVLPPLQFVPTKLVDEMVAPGGGNPNPAGSRSQPSRPKPEASPAEEAPPPKPKPAPKIQLKPKPVEDVDPAIERDISQAEEMAKSFEIVDKPKRKTLKKASDIVPTFDEVKPGKPNREATRKAREAAERQAREAAAERLSKLEAIAGRLENAVGNGTGLSLEPLGPGGAAYAYYGQEIMRRYEEAWKPAGQISGGSPSVQVQVTIRKDGSVAGEQILKRSGVGWLDRSVQEALDRVRVRKLPPFPEGAKDSERSFILDFNPKNKEGVG